MEFKYKGWVFSTIVQIEVLVQFVNGDCAEDRLTWTWNTVLEPQDAEINDILESCCVLKQVTWSIKDSIELVITAPKHLGLRQKKTKDVVENLIKNAEKSVVMTGIFGLWLFYWNAGHWVCLQSQQAFMRVRFYVNDIEKSILLVKMLAYRRPAVLEYRKIAMIRYKSHEEDINHWFG